MAYNLSRNYGTDYSRSDVRTILVNMAKELAAARGEELPTKTVFEAPEIVDENDNQFCVPVRPTVTDAGFSPENLVASECVRDGIYVRLTGTVGGGEGERDAARVVVRNAQNGDSTRSPSFDRIKEIHAKL